jgi:hypothetical protein
MRNAASLSGMITSSWKDLMIQTLRSAIESRARLTPEVRVDFNCAGDDPDSVEGYIRETHADGSELYRLLIYRSGKEQKAKLSMLFKDNFEPCHIQLPVCDTRKLYNLLTIFNDSYSQLILVPQKTPKDHVFVVGIERWFIVSKLLAGEVLEDVVMDLATHSNLVWELLAENDGQDFWEEDTAD